MFVEIQNVCKSYGDGGSYVRVLNNVTTQFAEGQICVILGPSGSGKSTLLNVIGGLDSVDEGSISVDGNEITNFSSKDIVAYRRKYIGFVFQFYNLVPNLTLRENVEVCQYLSQDPLNLDELLDVLNLHEHQNKYPSQLSGGQQQRCSVARALVKNPKLLLCDEPTGALDYKSSREMLILLEKINRLYGTTMLIVTHNDAIQKMANKVLHVKDGCIFESLNVKPIHASEIEW